MNAAVFLDRDNTLIRDVGDLSDPAQVRLLPGVASAIASLKSLGYMIVVVTNQPGIARGSLAEADVRAVHDKLNNMIFATAKVTVDRFYFCPFDPQGTIEKYKRDHSWRIPQPGMILHAAKDLSIDLSQSWTVGDELDDCKAGHAAGTRSILLNHGKSAFPNAPGGGVVGGIGRPNSDVQVPSYIARNLVEAVRIVGTYRKPDTGEGRNFGPNRSRSNSGPAITAPPAPPTPAVPAAPPVAPAPTASPATAPSPANPARQTPAARGPAPSATNATAIANAPTSPHPANRPSGSQPQSPTGSAPSSVTGQGAAQSPSTRATTAQAPSPASGASSAANGSRPAAATFRPAGAGAPDSRASAGKPSFASQSSTGNDELAHQDGPAEHASDHAPATGPAHLNAQGSQGQRLYDGRTASNDQLLRQILQEMRAQHLARKDVSLFTLASMSIQAAAALCFVAALLMGISDGMIFLRWIAIAIFLQGAAIAALLFRR